MGIVVVAQLTSAMNREISAGFLRGLEIDRDPPPPILYFNHCGTRGAGRFRPLVGGVFLQVKHVQGERYTAGCELHEI